MHLQEGEIRAYNENELASEEFNRAKIHLAGCTYCREIAAELGTNSRQIENRIGSLAADNAGPPLSEKEARAQLESLIQNSQLKEKNMWNKFTSAMPRAAWIGRIVILILAVGLAFAPVRAIANTFLGLFRVEQVRVIEFQAEDMPEDLGSSTQFEYMMSNQVNVQERGDPLEVADAAEASALAGFQVRLPTDVDDQSSLRVIPGGEITFNVDLEQVRTVLNDIGRSEIELPDSLDGAQVSANIQAGVEAQYGQCDMDEQELDDPDEPVQVKPLTCTTLIQAPGPVVEAPADMDIVEIGEAFLQITGMSPEEAADFSNNVDWTTTLIIPVPRHGTEHEDVLVDGVNGTLINYYEYKTGDVYLLVWIKDGVIYGLSGPGEKADALAIADSLQ